MNKKMMKSCVRLALGVTAAGALYGCGGSSDNDNGVSFTLYGFFQDAECETGLSGGAVEFGQDSSGDGNLPGVLAFYGLQNNLSRQGIRVQRAFLDYFVEGAAQQPPSTSIAMGGVLGPNAATPVGGDDEEEENDVPNGSLPPGFNNIEPQTCLENLIVTPDIMSWITLNRGSLPELPFSMNVRARVTGLTTAGDRLETNELDVPLVFVEGTTINPGSGAQSGAASDEAFDDVAESESEEGDL